MVLHKEQKHARLQQREEGEDKTEKRDKGDENRADGLEMAVNQSIKMKKTRVVQQRLGDWRIRIGNQGTVG